MAASRCFQRVLELEPENSQAQQEVSWPQCQRAWSDNLDMIIHYQMSFGQASANKAQKSVILSGLRGYQLDLLPVPNEQARMQVWGCSENHCCCLHWPDFTITKHGTQERPVVVIRQWSQLTTRGFFPLSLNTKNSFGSWGMQSLSLNMREWQRLDLRSETSGW